MISHYIISYYVIYFVLLYFIICIILYHIILCHIIFYYIIWSYTILFSVCICCIYPNMQWESEVFWDLHQIPMAVDRLRRNHDYLETTLEKQEHHMLGYRVCFTGIGHNWDIQNISSRIEIGGNWSDSALSIRGVRCLQSCPSARIRFYTQPRIHDLNNKKASDQQW